RKRRRKMSVVDADVTKILAEVALQSLAEIARQWTALIETLQHGADSAIGQVRHPRRISTLDGWWACDRSLDGGLRLAMGDGGSGWRHGASASSATSLPSFWYSRRMAWRR